MKRKITRIGVVHVQVPVYIEATDEEFMRKAEQCAIYAVTGSSDTYCSVNRKGHCTARAALSEAKVVPGKTTAEVQG